MELCREFLGDDWEVKKCFTIMEEIKRLKFASKIWSVIIVLGFIINSMKERIKRKISRRSGSNA